MQAKNLIVALDTQQKVAFLRIFNSNLLILPPNDISYLKITTFKLPDLFETSRMSLGTKITLF